MNPCLVKNYRNQDHLRHSFNTLAMKTFDGLSFEQWHQNGYWNRRYNPHSMIMNEEVIANVSVNLMDFMWNGQRKHLIQLGTVMTDERYRNQGLIRRIMNEIDREYGSNTDGIYLFANNSVLDFYPKFGFRKAQEYRYTKCLSFTQECSMVQVPMRGKADWKKLEDAMQHSVSYSRFNMTDNDNLILFYVTGFMQENVYYNQKYDSYIIAETDSDTLTVHNVFSKTKHPLDTVLAAFGHNIKQIILGFTPIDATGYTISKFREEDCTLFVKGSVFDTFEKDQVMFPTLSHA